MSTLAEIKALVGALPAGGLPIALLPVHVQTRYVVRDGASHQLLVRVYPDELHLDAHEPGLTAVEADWGRRYWELVWPPDTAARRRAWDTLAERFGSRRAAWIAKRLTPVNLAARPGTPPAFPDPGPARDESVSPPVLARALPDRWVVIGYRGGERVLIAAGAPIPDELAVSPGSDGAAPAQDGLDPRMRWMVDFEEAERAGMGIRIALAAPERFDTLLVLGVKATLGAEPSTARLEAVLDAHHYTRGLALLAPGAPTNNTAETSADFTNRDAGGFDVEVAPPRMGTGSDGAELARLLGIKRDLLVGVAGAARTEDLTAKRMQTALWPVTGGYYLDQLLQAERPFSAAQLDASKRFFVDFVRSQGPFPSLRVGRQPYGLVPALSMDMLLDESRLVRTLRGLRRAWRAALPKVPRLRPGSADEDALVEILRMQPVSVGHRARAVVERETFVPGAVLPSELAEDLRVHAELLRARMASLGGLATIERIFDALPARSSRPLSASHVTGADIKRLRTATFDELLADAPEVLLQALLRHAVLLAQATTAHRILARRGELPAGYREPVLVDVVGGMTFEQTKTLPRMIAPLRASIHALGAAQEPEAAALDELRAALQFLETVPADGLERHMNGCLDLFSYRLDAWITGLATRRLHELRRATPRGLAIGAFGWVEDLEPDERTPIQRPPEGVETPVFEARERGGAIHAPSMSQASAAAVLRSGYLNEASPAFAVDLRAERVRLAQQLLDGVREGQSLGALLGYRLERALHERGLDRFIAGFRRVSHLPDVALAEERLRVVTELGGINTALIFEAIKRLQERLAETATRLGAPGADAARLAELVAGKPADGLVLAKLFREQRLPFGQLGADISDATRAQLSEELRALDAALDAVGDALTAEGVYQAVRGNTARAAASVDALAHGELRPPELEVVETPRPGSAVTHRLAALFCATPVPAPLTGVRGARAVAEPALELWLRQMLGDLRQVIYAAEFVDAAGKVLARREKQPLGVLVPSPLDALYMDTDVVRLLEHALWKVAPAAATAVRLLPDRPPALPAGQLSLSEFLEVLRAFREVALGARALEARDLVPPGVDASPALDAAELAGRADAAVSALRRARAALAAPDDVRERLVDCFFLGFPDAIPAPRTEPSVAGTLAEADRRLAAVEAMTIDRAVASAPDQVAFDQERLRVVFGSAFRALPVLRPENLVELGSSLRRSDELQGGDPLQALSWLQGAARVRAGAARFDVALSYAAALERAPAKELKVAQLPFRAGERWIGLAGGAPAAGKVSLVAHLPRPFQTTAPLSGLLLDEWVEVIPSPEVTTGMAFNYDSAGARAPQSILLAVAPPGVARWDLEILEQTLLETLELAKLRAVDPQALGDDALLQRALPALYVSTNLKGDTISTDFRKLAKV